MPTDGVYSRAELENEFRQSEVLTGVHQYYYNAEHDRVDRTTKSHSVILSQECDLLQDFNSRRDGKAGGLNGILLFEAMTVAVARSGGMQRGVFEKIAANGVERYHFLQACHADGDAAGVGLPELIIDFKKYFTVSVGDLHWQLTLSDGPKRRTRLISPYMEHLQSRAAHYMARIALPVPHEVGGSSYQQALPSPVPV